MLYLGVDGGNTKTIALACGADGRIAGHARTGCSDVYSVDAELAVGEIVRARARPRSPPPAAARSACAYYSLAGADWPVDIAFYESELARRVPAARTVVVNDAIGAIRCGADDGVGCSLVCGTGTAIGARARDGRLWHMSWLAAPYLHDRPHARDARRRRAQRARADAAERAAGARGGGLRRARTRSRAIERVTGRAPRPPRVSLGGLLLDCAAEGDELALERVVAGSRARTPRYLRVARARVRSRRADADHARRRRHAPPLVAARRRAGRGAARAASCGATRREPAHGALLAALDEGGAEPVALDDSALPGDLFATARVA